MGTHKIQKNFDDHPDSELSLSILELWKLLNLGFAITSRNRLEESICDGIHRCTDQFHNMGPPEAMAMSGSSLT